MKLKTLAVAVVILAVLSAAAYWANRSPAAAPSDSRIGQPLVATSIAGDIARIRVTDQGKSVEAVRQPDGTWRVPSYYDFPADFSKVSTLVSDATSAKIDRLVTTNPDRIARLGFGGSSIAFLDATGRTLAAVDLGRNADTGGRFVRFGPEPKAYLASFNSYLDAEPKDWADPNLMNLKGDDVAKIEIPFDQGPPVVVARTKADQPWTSASTPSGEQVSADKISGLLSSLDSLHFTDTADPSAATVVAARAHERVFKLTTFDGKTTVVALGRKPEETKPAPAAAKPAEAKKDAQAPAPPPPETIPAGPVYVFFASPDPSAPINALMARRAFQIDDYVFTSLPQKAAELFEAAPSKK